MFLFINEIYVEAYIKVITHNSALKQCQNVNIMAWQNFILNFPAGRMNMPIWIPDSLCACPAALGLTQHAMFLQPCWLLLSKICLTEVLCNLKRNRRDLPCTPKPCVTCIVGLGNGMAHKTGTLISRLLFYSYTQDGHHWQINASPKPVTHGVSIFRSSISSAMFRLYFGYAS